ncbi:hypothetical protein DVH24_013833 [Malus domestica]|uniref:OBG-type G domain-containing protein n=1 Tax=Malus domestica TaxID=3750 RepID=A0A498JEK2_MALDO|nr:hypothetical protein DVH24_013833 [Malus domestica]
MSRASTLFQLWQTPNRLPLAISKISKGPHLIPSARSYPVLCFCKEIQTSTYEVVKGSYVPSPVVKPVSKAKEKSPENIEDVGAFQKLPMVMPSVDILYSALRKAKRITPTKGIANIAKRERNRGAKQLDALMKELALPLRTYSENFPNKKYLHPYERSLIELTLGDGNYEQVLGKVDALRKKVVSIGKEHASLCAKSTTKKEAEARLTEGIKKVEETFNREGKHVDDLLHIAKTLRAMPVVDLEAPTLCLVGAPNVGKSSLVRILSTGKPEVTDTPGLLKRCDEDRNNLEKLTLAVLSHLPTAILYVHDLSGECGTSPSDQFVIYKEIKERFGEHLWLDVVSKCDLLQKSPVLFATDNGDDSDLKLERYRKLGPDGAIHVSVMNEVGLAELKSRVQEMLDSQMTRIQVQEGNKQKLEVC